MTSHEMQGGHAPTAKRPGLGAPVNCRAPDSPGHHEASDSQTGITLVKQRQ